MIFLQLMLICVTFICHISCFVSLLSSFFLPPLRWHKLPLHARAEACFTGWPNPRKGTSVVLRDTIRLTWWCVWCVVVARPLEVCRTKEKIGSGENLCHDIYPARPITTVSLVTNTYCMMQYWWTFLSGSLPSLYYFKVITTLYLLLANKISDGRAFVSLIFNVFTMNCASCWCITSGRALSDADDFSWSRYLVNQWDRSSASHTMPFTCTITSCHL